MVVEQRKTLPPPLDDRLAVTLNPSPRRSPAPASAGVCAAVAFLTSRPETLRSKPEDTRPLMRIFTVTGPLPVLSRSSRRGSGGL